MIQTAQTAPPQRPRAPGPPEERFWRHVQIADADECWLWTSATGRGYGQFWDGRFVKAHRWSYEHFIGPIPEGLQIDHLCRQRLCVNPYHLEPVTAGVNLNRRPDAPAGRTHCPAGHPYDAANTYIAPSGKRRRDCRACRADAMRRYKQRHAS